MAKKGRPTAVVRAVSLSLSNQVPGSMGSRNGNVVRGTLLKLGFNTTGTRLFPRSRNGTNIPSSRLLSTELPGCGFEAASAFAGEGLPRFIPSLDPTHMGDSGSGSALVY
jgi:hypothetical protein